MPETNHELHFPLAAVVGADDLKLALCLTAIDPKIGGVLIEGPRGMAKSTLARGLADLLASGHFVTLPLGATEDRLLGTLDLDAALGAGQVRFCPGVLAKADGGVLYVDEVNLLADPLVDLLLDVAASGSNRVERDGISHQHPARFVLIGTMNPEEGELRPQLLDRFGLNVLLSGQPEPGQRGQIVRRRLAFDNDPLGFCHEWAAAQDALRERCERARVLLDTIALDDNALAQINQRCFAAGVDGLRADLVWLRAARAHAAWRGNGYIEAVDIEAVAEFALRHRRHGKSEQASSAPAPDTQDSCAPTQQTPRHKNAEPLDTAAGNPQPSAQAQPDGVHGAPSAEKPGGQWGALAPQPVAAGARREVPSWPKKP